MSSPAQRRLVRNHEAFTALVGTAQEYVEHGRISAAAAAAHVAAQFAWLNPTGLFASAELEQLLVRLARRIPAPAATARRRRDPEVVLHVATQAYPTGGSTQYLASWAGQDHGRRHIICLTRQQAAVPAKLRSLADGRVSVRTLDRVAGGIVGRATELRRIAGEADVVLVHAHPGDVVPMLALAGQPVPVVHVDQADHVFWVGSSIVGTLLSMRRSGATLATQRRGVDPERIVTVPRPLQFPSRTMTRADAKKALGMDPGSVVILTAADQAKYRSVSGPSLLEMVLPVLRSTRSVRLLAAGPAPDGEWADAMYRTSGRVSAMGPVSDMKTLHHAADIYLDSFPFSSLTSMLESGSLGNPLVTFDGHPAECAVLGADTPCLDGLMNRPTQPALLQQVLTELIDDRERRAAQGAGVEEAIRRTHSGQSWSRDVEHLYRAAADASQPRLLRRSIRGDGALDQLVLAVMERSPYSEGVPGALHSALGQLPPTHRAAAAIMLYRHGRRLRPPEILSDRMRSTLGAARRGLLSPTS